MYSINSTNRDLAELRSMQDWYLRYQLASVEGVSEVASVGGFREAIPGHRGPDQTARLQPLRSPKWPWRSSAATARWADAPSNCRKRSSSCGSRGYIQKLEDLRKVAVGVGDKGVPILLRPGRQRGIRPGHAARHRRTQWRRRNRRRRGRGALRRQRPAGHSRREEEAGSGHEGPAGGREIHHRL